MLSLPSWHRLAIACRILSHENLSVDRTRYYYVLLAITVVILQIYWALRAMILVIWHLSHGSTYLYVSLRLHGSFCVRWWLGSSFSSSEGFGWSVEAITRPGPFFIFFVACAGISWIFFGNTQPLWRLMIWHPRWEEEQRLQVAHSHVHICSPSSHFQNQLWKSEMAKFPLLLPVEFFTFLCCEHCEHCEHLQADATPVKGKVDWDMSYLRYLTISCDILRYLGCPQPRIQNARAHRAQDFSGALVTWPWPRAT